MLVNKKTKYFRKALRVIKSTQFSTKGKISKVLQELLSHGIYAKYNTENKNIVFAISTDSCELDFIRKKINLDKNSLKILIRKQKAIYDFSKSSFFTHKEYLLSVDDLYKNSLQVSGFDNILKDVLSKEQFNQLLFNLTKYLLAKDLKKFCKAWKITKSKIDLEQSIFNIFIDNSFIDTDRYLNNNQKDLLLYYLKESVESILDIENIFQDEMLEESVSNFELLFTKLIKSIEETKIKNPLLSQGLVSVLKKFIQHDNSYSGILQFLTNYDSKKYQDIITNTNKVLREYNMALLNRNDKKIDYDSLSYKVVVDDYTKYSDISLFKILPYFSYLIEGHYIHGSLDVKNVLQKKLERILKRRFKHNILIYIVRGECYISILNVYQDDLTLFLNLISKNLKLLFINNTSNDYEVSLYGLEKDFNRIKSNIIYNKIIHE